MTAPNPLRSEARDSEEMSSYNCAAVQWALDQDVCSASASRLLVEIARFSVDSKCARTQRSLGEACKLSERQTRTLIASLVADGFVKRMRNGGTGAGRSADAYELVGYCEQPAETKQPAISADSQSQATGNGQSSPLDTGNIIRLPKQPAISDRKNLPVEATGNGIPHTPLDITTNLSNPEREEFELEGGLGETKPKRKASGTKRRPRREKFYATADTMPAQPNDEMVAYALTKGMRNGTLSENHGKFCRYHIRKRTLIASLEQRWETWVDNWAEKNPIRDDGAKPGFKLIGHKPDGTPVYDRTKRQTGYP